MIEQATFIYMDSRTSPPVNTHRRASVPCCAVPTACHLNERRALIQQAVVGLPLVMGEDQRVSCMGRDRQSDVRLKQSVTDDSESGEHRPAKDYR
jgi:hypothetical protein